MVTIVSLAMNIQRKNPINMMKRDTPILTAMGMIIITRKRLTVTTMEKNPPSNNIVINMTTQSINMIIRVMDITIEWKNKIDLNIK